MTFEKFERKGRASRPIIGIGKHGTITINDICYVKYFGDATHVSFYYDREKKIVGIKPEKKGNDAAYPLRKQPTGGAMVSGRGFLRYFDIELDKSSRFTPRWNVQLELVEVDIGKNGEN